MLLIPQLPIIPISEIASTYVKLEHGEVVYNNFVSSRLLTISGDSLYTSVCSATASLTNSLSGHYQTIRMYLYNEGYQDTATGLTDNMGFIFFRKRFFDTSIVKGALTATVTGALAGDFYDSGSGQFIRKSSGLAIGSVLNDFGLVTITASDAYTLIQSLTSLRYQAEVVNTTINVFCTCKPNELNFSRNPTAFETTQVGNWLLSGYTANTENAIYKNDFTSSGYTWQPHITTIGLYDDENNLLAVSKLSKPIRKPISLPITFALKIDI